MPHLWVSCRAYAPVAQLDRVLPSEGRGHRFESCRVRHFHVKPTIYQPIPVIPAPKSVGTETQYSAWCWLAAKTASNKTGQHHALRVGSFTHRNCNSYSGTGAAQ